MDAPTTTEILEWSDAPLSSLGYPDGAKLQRKIDVAASTFSRITGLALADVPDSLVVQVQEAIQGITEEMIYRGQADRLDTMADFDLIQSFSAGPYSETRRSMTEMREARMLHPWMWVSDLLWGLLTPDQYAWWEEFFGGKVAPAFGVQEVDWDGDPYRVDNGFTWGA